MSTILFLTHLRDSEVNIPASGPSKGREIIVYAHSTKNADRSDWESLKDHSTRVARAAAVRASIFGAADVAAALGLLHDLGKAKPAFQAKLAGDRNDVGHSGEGARILAQTSPIGEAFAGIVAGHHGTLPNPGRLARRLERAELLPLPDWCVLPDIVLPDWTRTQSSRGPSYRLQFLVRMLYSCLTDADDRETAAFYAEAERHPTASRLERIDKSMRAHFDAHMADLAGHRPIDALRRRVLDHARTRATQAPGLFTLTVPTGGGKTLTSLGFALDHALHHGLRRLIYVIPYMSIVEQTAAVFRDVLGDDAVLEHHSSFDMSDMDETETEQRRVASASWDVPIVVTTAVQFFESLYAARKKRCRKLHSLAGSVIVIDEAQTMPLGFLRPCLSALAELMSHYGASVVLCTATQPALTAGQGFPAPEALGGAREIAPDPAGLYRALKRVRVRDIGDQSDEALAARMRAADQALLIVDNRVQARGLFDALRDAAGAAHLSTLMTAAHRRAVLADVRERLMAGAPVRLVSTSLIEAGVDVSFPLVLRAAAGIDSIAQAAGRCNRNGDGTALGEVLVFRSEHDAPPAVEQFAAIGREVLAAGFDPIGQEAVAMYFRRLWETYGSEALDSADVGETAQVRGILAAIDKGGLACPFEDVAEAFRLIPDGQKSVVIRGGDHGVPEETLKALAHRSPGVVARQLQPYTVSVPHKVWRGLWDAGAVAWWEREKFDAQFAVLGVAGLYDESAGLGVAEFEDLGSMVY